MISIYSLVRDLFWTNFVEFDNTHYCYYASTRWEVINNWRYFYFIANWNQNINWQFLLLNILKLFDYCYNRMPDYHFTCFLNLSIGNHIIIYKGERRVYKLINYRLSTTWCSFFCYTRYLFITINKRNWFYWFSFNQKCGKFNNFNW